MRGWLICAAAGLLLTAATSGRVHAAQAATQSTQAEEPAKPAEPKAEDDKGWKVDLKKGVPVIQWGAHNSLQIGARVQVRYTAEDREQFDADGAGTTGFGQEDSIATAFAVQRMRLSLKGGMFRPWLKYEFQFELANTSGESDNKVKDAFLDFGAKDAWKIRTGQYKTPFSLQQLTSSGRLQFVDRAITDNKFAPGRDVGVMVHGLLAEKRFGYSAGVFNGGGEGRAQDDEAMLYVGRVWFDPLAPYELSEAALGNTDKAQLHIGLGYRTGEEIKGSVTTAALVEDPDDESALNLELAYRRNRLFATAEGFAMTDERQNPAVAPDVDSNGWNVQVGWMFLADKRLELALRYSAIEPDEDVDDADVTETRLGASWYWQAHNLKLQADVAQVEFEQAFAALSPIAARNLPSLGTRLVAGQDYEDLQFRLQATLAF